MRPHPARPPANHRRGRTPAPPCPLLRKAAIKDHPATMYLYSYDSTCILQRPIIYFPSAQHCEASQFFRVRRQDRSTSFDLIRFCTFSGDGDSHNCN